MNRAVQALALSGVIGVSGLLMANKFTGDAAIEEAKAYVKDSYSLLEKYDIKQKGLREEIKSLEGQIANKTEDNELLSKEIQELNKEIKNIETEKQNLLESIAGLEEQIQSEQATTFGIKQELQKANLEITNANTKVEELKNLLVEKDLSKFNPDNDEQEIKVENRKLEISHSGLFDWNEEYWIEDGDINWIMEFRDGFTIAPNGGNYKFTAIFEDGSHLEFIEDGCYTPLYNGNKSKIVGMEARVYSDYTLSELTKIINYEIIWLK